MVAEEILAACDDSGGSGGMVGGEGQAGLANPAIHLLRGLRHRNLAAIRHAAQVGHSARSTGGPYGTQHRWAYGTVVPYTV